MTTSIREQVIQPSWPIEKIQERNVKHVAAHIAAKIELSNQQSEEVVKQFRKETASTIGSHMKQCGVKSPLDLVRHMAEDEANLYGAQVAIDGDDSEASLIFKKPTVWLAVKEMIQMTPEQKTRAKEGWREWLSELAEVFGFRAKLEAEGDTSARITFSRQ